MVGLTTFKYGGFDKSKGQETLKIRTLKVLEGPKLIRPEVALLEVVIDNFKPKITRPFKRKNEYWVKLILSEGEEYIMKFKTPLEAEDAIYGMLDDLQVYGGKVKLQLREGNVIEKIEVLELYKPSAKELLNEYFTD